MLTSELDVIAVLSRIDRLSYVNNITQNVVTDVYESVRSLDPRDFYFVSYEFAGVADVEREKGYFDV